MRRRRLQTPLARNSRSHRRLALRGAIYEALKQRIRPELIAWPRAVGGLRTGLLSTTRQTNATTRAPRTASVEQGERTIVRLWPTEAGQGHHQTLHGVLRAASKTSRSSLRGLLFPASFTEDRLPCCCPCYASGSSSNYRAPTHLRPKIGLGLSPVRDPQ
jgi:hypothetical protein